WTLLLLDAQAPPGCASPADLTQDRDRHVKLPQKRWMRRHASSTSSVLIAYEMRNAGPKPNGVPCTTATPSASNSSLTKSSSLTSLCPVGAVLPMAPAQDG